MRYVQEVSALDTVVFVANQDAHATSRCSVHNRWTDTWTVGRPGLHNLSTQKRNCRVHCPHTTQNRVFLFFHYFVRLAVLLQNYIQYSNMSF